MRRVIARLHAERRYPAEHYVLIDDKVRILSAVKTVWGDDVTTVGPGDHVVLTWNVPCRSCPHCLRGEAQLCLHGYDHAYGAPYAESGAGPFGLWRFEFAIGLYGTALLIR